MSRPPVALITGCGQGGIGHALAKQLRGKGYHVIATLLPFEDRQHLDEADIQVEICDVTSNADVSALEANVSKASHGQLDLLVNNAGLCYTMTAADTEIHEVEKMFAVNVFGPMRMIRHLHRMLVRAQGTVVNIGSVGGIVPYIYGASYNASKAALHHYGNTLRAEMKPFGVRVVNIISGEVSTNILKTDRKNERRLPDGSLYSPLAEDFRQHIARTPSTITPDQYAAGVVEMITKPSPPSWFWFGAQTSIVRWGDMLLPRTFWDWLFWRMFKFDKLRAEAMGL
ncbi:hypothetical protein BDW62DRAFT_215952 [Aspergillus aurantiobrunneus]